MASNLRYNWTCQNIVEEWVCNLRCTFKCRTGSKVSGRAMRSSILEERLCNSQHMQRMSSSENESFALFFSAPVWFTVAKRVRVKITKTYTHETWLIWALSKTASRACQYTQHNHSAHLICIVHKHFWTHSSSLFSPHTVCALYSKVFHFPSRAAGRTETTDL